MEKAQRGCEDPFLSTFLDVRKTAQRELAQRTKEALEAAVPALPEMSAEDAADLVSTLEAHLLATAKWSSSAWRIGMAIAYRENASGVDCGMVHLWKDTALYKNAWWKTVVDWNETCFSKRAALPLGAPKRHNDILDQAIERVCATWNARHPEMELTCSDSRELYFEVPNK